MTYRSKNTGARIVCGLALLAILEASTPRAFALLPPWYYYHRVLKATIGQSPCASVGELKAPEAGSHSYTVVIQGCTTETAHALALVLNASADSVDVRTAGPDGAEIAADSPPLTADEAKLALRSALVGNPVVVGIVDRAAMASSFSLAFKPQVIQIQADNISDPYRNVNLTAQEAFALVLRQSYGPHLRMGFTTSEVKAP